MPYESGFEMQDYDEPGVIEVPAMQYGEQGKLSQINQYLMKHRNSSKSVKELLCIDNNCKIDKKFNFIIDNAGVHHLPSKLLAIYGIGEVGAIRCPLCKKPIQLDGILDHLESTFEKGHKLNTRDTIKLFSMEWWLWSYTNSQFRYRGSDISFEPSKN